MEVTEAGENLPLSLMAKFTGASESCACLLRLIFKRRALQASLKRGWFLSLRCTAVLLSPGLGFGSGSCLQSVCKPSRFPDVPTIVCKSPFL